MSDMRSRVALVTGSSRGIGRAVALAIGAAGAAVAVNDRGNRDEALAAVEAIRRVGGNAAAFGADVSQGAAVARMVADAAEQLGPVDILVDNAGIAIMRGREDTTEDDFDRTIAVNLRSAFPCTEAVLPGMRARRWGRIVNVSSIGARIGSGSVNVAYGASKA